MRNQPKYHFFKNTGYALAGLKDMIRTESSFRIELVLFVLMFPVIFILDASMTQSLFLFSSLILVLIAETVNSSIERVVDLVTLDNHEMAKRAKDIGSSIVFLSLIHCVCVWLFIISGIYFF